MHVDELKELINTVFEGLISLTVVIGSGLLISQHADSTPIVASATAASAMVLTFWFGQRATTKAVNGNISALAGIATNLIITSKAGTQAATPEPASAAGT